MIKLKKIVNEIIDAAPPSKPTSHDVRQSQSESFSSDFINYIKSVENGIGVGYDKKKKLWFPHRSYEGGMPTIGYGHKVKNAQELESFKKGISNSAVLKLLETDLSVANRRVHDYIKKKYGINLMLTKKQNEMLTDFAFNLGGLDKFPKFTDAVLRNKWDVVKKEYIRKAGGRDLKGRNTAFYNRFLR
jgi:GH24 family phage-related lysozyme (muramidase)